ncbi:UNVERIFIED_CONTAM: 50S ribosomal protein L21, putative [Hammondia hammondi]|eukprot:XP_008884519.1 50S ribosomal protein L21, putative [Hammondia hammondi]
MLARGSPWRLVLPGRSAKRAHETPPIMPCRPGLVCEIRNAERLRRSVSCTEEGTAKFGQKGASQTRMRQEHCDANHGSCADPRSAAEASLCFFRSFTPSSDPPSPLQCLFRCPRSLNALSSSALTSLSPLCFSSCFSSCAASASRSSPLSVLRSFRLPRQNVAEQSVPSPVSLSTPESLRSPAVPSRESSSCLGDAYPSAASYPRVRRQSSCLLDNQSSEYDLESSRRSSGTASELLGTFPRGPLPRRKGGISFSSASLPDSISSPSPFFGCVFLRRLQIYPQRRVIGHRIEIFRGKHRRRRMVPPRIPLHPLAANTSEETASKDMNLFETYRDLQLRWKKTCRQRKKKFNIARKWRMPRNIRPLPDPSWTLVFHVNPRSGYRRGQGVCRDRRRQKLQGDTSDVSAEDEENRLAGKEASTRDADDTQRGRGARETSLRSGAALDAAIEEENILQILARHPDKGRIEGSGRPRGADGWGRDGPLPQWMQILQRTPQEELFCVMKSNVSTQHKVTAGDLIQAEKLHRKQAGDKVVFGTVMLVGSRDWTIIGKPTVPFAKVEATVEEQTLAGETLSFFYRKSRRVSRFRRIRHCVTMLRIDRIIVDPNMTVDPPPPKPDRLLDLWANRWLYPDELDGIKRNESGEPVVSEIYDGREHQKGSYQRRGLTASYRWYPDPQSAHWRP